MVACFRMRNDRFYHVDASELEPYSVVVTTTITARMLWLNGVDRGYFTHILIDEAAQVNIRAQKRDIRTCTCGHFAADFLLIV